MLDAAGFSPAVMQGNNDFSVAGSFSVNAHGWPVPCGPLGSTVQAIRLMLMDGAIVTCSRTENRELFGLVMGGNGLFGIVLDLELKMVPNCFLEATYEVMASEEFGTHFVKAIYSEPSPHMAYGRLNVARRNFLGEATMVTYRSTTTPGNGFQVASNGNLLSTATRALYRAQTGSEFGKKVRWLAETVIGPLVLPNKVTRNTLLNIPISELVGRDHERTDILHEYFLPPESFQDFIAACRKIIPRHRQDCLNVTMRFVEADLESVLAYAPNRRIAAVMAFSQEMTPAAEADMLLLTEALIDRVLELGGSFYLPYRLHARRDQVEAAYGNTQYFVDRKYHYDPGLLFLNAMWDAYFR